MPSKPTLTTLLLTLTTPTVLADLQCSPAKDVNLDDAKSAISNLRATGTNGNGEATCTATSDWPILEKDGTAHVKGVPAHADSQSAWW